MKPPPASQSEVLLKKLIAVVITTYNNPLCLERCLLSLTNQTYQNFEVYIADDGSSDETRELIAGFKKQASFQIYHCWHPDEGYRKAKINNKVFAQLRPEQYPLMICIDHDVILHYRFIEDHYCIHEENQFKPLLFMGRRVDLGKTISEKIVAEKVTQFNLGLGVELLNSSLKGETRNILRSYRIRGPNWLLKLLKRDRVYDLLGSNFSLSTEVMHAVNGYNEDYQSYWGEDGDLFVRIRNSGVKILGRIGYAIQWHLFHKRLEETEAHINAYQKLLKDDDYKICKNGIIKIK